MAKHKDIEYGDALFHRLQQIAAGGPDDTRLATAVAAYRQREQRERPRELRKMKKFRFQLLHRWLVERLEPCRVADIAGGKGLLAYLLRQSDWPATVIDPDPQSLPTKYKDLATGQRRRIPATETVPLLNQPFTAEMGQSFDLLIGIHAHGCNVAVMEAAARYGCGYILFPCCLIDEPFWPLPGVTWLESLAAFAVERQQAIEPFRLNFKGQNIGFFYPGRCQFISL